MSTRVFVAGVAAYTCCGLGAIPFCARLMAHIAPNGQAAKGVPYTFPPLEVLGNGDRRSPGDHPLAERLLAAVEHDLGAHLRKLAPKQRRQLAVALGTAYARPEPCFAYFQKGIEEGYQWVNSRHFTFVLPNSCTASLSGAYPLGGSSTTGGRGWTAGLEAIACAAEAIRGGREQIVLAGGVDEANDHNRSVLAQGRLQSPSGAVLPFSEVRDGTVAGDGVAVLMMSSEEMAAVLGRDPLAEIVGTASARELAWDRPASRQRALETLTQALSSAGMEVKDVQAVFPSAGGTVAGDAFEEAVLRDLFGSRLSSVAVYPVKAVSGECFAASGALQCLAAVAAIAFAPRGGPPSEQATRNGNGLWLAKRVRRHATALVYGAGYDGRFSALVMRKPTTA